MFGCAMNHRNHGEQSQTPKCCCSDGAKIRITEAWLKCRYRASNCQHRKLSYVSVSGDIYQERRGYYEDPVEDPMTCGVAIKAIIYEGNGSSPHQENHSLKI
ncbi:hypothetical protein ACMFMF_010575 [Clarireedia jacksonii]